MLLTGTELKEFANMHHKFKRLYRSTGLISVEQSGVHLTNESFLGTFEPVECTLAHRPEYLETEDAHYTGKLFSNHYGVEYFTIGNYAEFERWLG